MNEPTITAAKTLEGQMISDIQEINGVRNVSVSRTGDTFDVSVIIESMDFSKFDAVVQKELQLYAEFPRFTFHFDINPSEATDAA